MGYDQENMFEELKHEIKKYAFEIFFFNEIVLIVFACLIILECLIFFRMSSEFLNAQ